MTEHITWDWRWHDETRTILIFEVFERWTWQDAAEAIDKQVAEMATVDHKVQTVFILQLSGDRQSLGQIPAGNALTNLKRLILTSHPNEDMVIFVGKNMMLETFINVVSKVHKLAHLTTRYHYVATLEEALDLAATRQFMVGRA